MVDEKWLELKEKMKKARLKQVHTSSFNAEQNKVLSLGIYKFDCGDGTEIIDTPIRRLVEDAAYSDATLVENFKTLYFRYLEMGLDLVDEIEIKEHKYIHPDTSVISSDGLITVYEKSTDAEETRKNLLETDSSSRDDIRQ